MTEIYLIRHAQAEGNRYHMMQGHWDGGVTALGRRQIEELAERFRGIPLDAVYASDLYRARLTAGAAARWGRLPIRTDPALRELNVGPWEGRFFGDLKWEDPESIRLFITDPDAWRLDGAETCADVTRRAWPALEAIARRHEGQRVAVVSHGVTIRCLLSRILGISLKEVSQLPISGNTAVSLLHWEDGRFAAEYINDVSHLSEGSRITWRRAGDLRGAPLSPREDRVYYESCYADAWRFAHGDLEGFSPEPYFEAARGHLRVRPEAVLRFYEDEQSAGLLDLDPLRGKRCGCGWVSLLYLEPAYRGKGCGVQLLARAYSFFKAEGRNALRLHVAEDNETALAFYLREGFRQIGSEGGGHGKLLLMEKKLGVRDDA